MEIDRRTFLKLTAVGGVSLVLPSCGSTTLDYTVEGVQEQADINKWPHQQFVFDNQVHLIRTINGQEISNYLEPTNGLSFMLYTANSQRTIMTICWLWDRRRILRNYGNPENYVNGFLGKKASGFQSSSPTVPSENEFQNVNHDNILKINSRINDLEKAGSVDKINFFSSQAVTFPPPPPNFDMVFAFRDPSRDPQRTDKNGADEILKVVFGQ